MLKHGHEIEVAQEIIEWVVSAGDTLLVRRELKGDRVLMRLLYQGEVQLYKLVGERNVRQYYLFRGTQREPLTPWSAPHLGRLFMIDDCSEYKHTNAISHDAQAVELTRRINECLGANV